MLSEVVILCFKLILLLFEFSVKVLEPEVDCNCSFNVHPEPDSKCYGISRVSSFESIMFTTVRLLSSFEVFISEGFIVLGLVTPVSPFWCINTYTLGLPGFL